MVRVLISDAVSCYDTSTGSFIPQDSPPRQGGGVSPPQIPSDDRGGEYLFSPDSPSDRGGEYTSRGFLDIFVRDSFGLFIE